MERIRLKATVIIFGRSFSEKDFSPAYKVGLLLSTLHFSEEVREIEDVPWIKDVPSPEEEDIDLAKELIERLSSSFDPSEYENTYRKRLEDVIRRKARGEEVKVGEVEEEKPTKDIRKKLEQSLESV